MQLIPVGGHQFGRIDVRPAPTDRGDQLRRQFAVGDRQRNAEVIGFDLPAGLPGRALDGLAAGPRLVGSQEAAQPSVSQRADSPERRWCRAAQPDVQRGLGRGATAAAVTVKYRPL